MKKVLFILGSLLVFSQMLQASPHSCHLIVYSTKSLADVKKAQQKYLYSQFKRVAILKNNRDWFMLSVAKVDKKVEKNIVSRLKALKKIPKDSLCSGIEYPEIDVKNTTHKSNKQHQNIFSKQEQKTAVVKINQAITQYLASKETVNKLYNAINHSSKEILNTQNPAKKKVMQHAQLIKKIKESQKQLTHTYNDMVNIYTNNLDILKTAKGGKKIASFLKDERQDILVIIKKVAKINIQQLCQHQKIDCK
ncbi:Uncharacterised protein [Phocoenobacter uteri]|uniref:Uncharacterized protein n=1 Tax=Phocoenobacter uteri TaxID=146806 RepID=A0A379CAY8_9PAST|nr:hypothetical protein [Phocoenobacter uteri]MDG6881512.1 hypothetical protein [Phocoenobacter uteri]SUB59542.1 Uncharacterised protein [Phocoenobacter uteri]